MRGFLIFLAVVVAFLCIWRRSIDPGLIMDEVYNGVVRENPADMASRLGVSVEALSLARAMTSEERAGHEGARVAVGWAILNYARRLGTTITRLVTRSGKLKSGLPSHPEADGLYSVQALGKYCSTFDQATIPTINQAADILAERIPDPTGGAERFDNPVLQDILAKAKPYNPISKSGYHTADEVASRRVVEGYVAIAIPDTTTRFWRKA